MTINHATDGIVQRFLKMQHPKMTWLTMDELDLGGKRVLIREDLNVAIAQGAVVNDTRIQAALPTIRQAVATAAQVIIMSHLGRPQEGTPIGEQPLCSLQPVAARLGQLLTCQIPVVADYLQDPASVAHAGKLVMLENVRINLGEKANADSLARRYARLCDVFVMDAFGTAHRAQASTHGVAKFAGQACAGPLLVRELQALERALINPRRPLLAIIGGAKVADKLQLLTRLSTLVDQLIVGGGIANTFLLASGVGVGRSLCEPELVAVARKLLTSTSIPLPTDVVVAPAFDAAAKAIVKPVADIADQEMILDIGPDTVRRFGAIIAEMQSIIWNGPVGVFEFDAFAGGTRCLAEAVAANPGFSLAGGGETIAAIDRFGVTDDISYISTGGGAFLEYLQGVELPAVQILRPRSQPEGL